ncbi:hypothetical protein [Absidia glauca]|uniref:Uncharacterized protein n=1 Tax=Absidia glauca TaxID=4829 RepID=A0A163KD06_ABSGL|nr:hypothetical protein [Absidia glauca]
MRLNRNDNGQFSIIPNEITAIELDQVISLMRQRIQSFSGSRLAPFKKIFFVAYGHGFKRQVKKLTEFIIAFENDLDMTIAMDSMSNMYLDYALEMIRNGTCGVWVNNAYPVVNDLECHLPALAPFFPSAELIKSNYRYDGVLGFASLAGCGYKASPSVDGVGEFGVRSVKMYSTFKRPFFHRQSGRWRHVKELLPYDAWNCDSKKENYFVSELHIHFVRTSATL